MQGPFILGDSEKELLRLFDRLTRCIANTLPSYLHPLLQLPGAFLDDMPHRLWFWGAAAGPASATNAILLAGWLAV